MNRNNALPLSMRVCVTRRIRICHEQRRQPDQLRTRILLWTEEEIRLDRLPPKSGAILEALLYRGELPRGDAAAIVGTGERQARHVVSALTDKGVVTSESSRAPLRLAFPAALASRWMPGLFPEKVRVGRKWHAAIFSFRMRTRLRSSSISARL